MMSTNNRVLGLDAAEGNRFPKYFGLQGGLGFANPPYVAYAPAGTWSRNPVMLRMRPLLSTAKSVPLIGLSPPSGPKPQEKRRWSPKPLGSPISLNLKSGKRCCTPEIRASTPSWPAPDISGSTYLASLVQFAASISRRRPG